MIHSDFAFLIYFIHPVKKIKSLPYFLYNFVTFFGHEKRKINGLFDQKKKKDFRACLLQIFKTKKGNRFFFFFFYF